MKSTVQQYFDSFFDHNEKDLFMSELNYDGKFYNYVNSEPDEWKKAETLFKSLLPYGHLDDFYMEINKNATSFIDQLFSRYIDDDTFTLSILEHESIINNVNKLDKKMILTWNIVKSLDFKSIINTYQNSGCHKLFIYCSGIIESNIIPQEFYIELKKHLVEHNIQHTFIFDDVQSMFVVPRDYRMFDCVLFTCHSLVPHYNSGILFSKKDEQMGFRDAKPLCNFIDILKPTFIDKKENIYLFRFMIEQFLAKELFRTDVFYLPPCVSWNMFFLVIIKAKLVNNVINQYKDQLVNFKIDFYDNTVMIKLNFILQKQPQEIIHGLECFKKMLQKIIKINDIMG